MSYNILSKNVQFQGATQGTIENMVDLHTDQTVGGKKTITHLTGTNAQITNDLKVSGKIGIGSEAHANYNAVITVDDSDLGGGLLIDDNETDRNISALRVESENTNNAGYVAYFEGRRVGYFNQDIDDGFGATFYRSRGANAESSPLVSITDGGAGNTQPTLKIMQYGNGDIINLYDGATEVFTVDATGSVGIHTNTPLEALHVVGNITGSQIYGTFHGDGSALTGIGVSLASGSGLTNSGGLRVDPSQSTAIAGSINDNDNVTVYSTADSAPRKVTVADIAGRATVPISTYTNTGGNANRVVVSIDGSGVVARSNLTFDNSDLLLTGNMSGSGNLQIGGTVRFDGISTESPSFSQDHIMFVDATDSLVTKATFSNFCASIAGDGLVNSSGRLAVQVTGAAIVVSDKVGISGSIAGTGLGFTGAANSVSAINLDLTDVGFGGGANRLITDDGDGTVTTEANLTFDGSLLTITGTGSLDRVVIGGTDPAESRLLISGSNDELLFQVKQQGNGYPTMFLGGENHATYPELLYNRGQFLNLGAISQGNLAGNNGSNTKLTIRKTGVLDNTATSIVAFTIPNANHAAGFKVFGFVTTDSGSRVGTFEQQIAISRVSGSIAAFAGSTRVESSRANSGGSGADFTISTDLTQSGSASASNTLDYELTIDTTDGSSTNAVISVELLNFNDSGITMAAS